MSKSATERTTSYETDSNSDSDSGTNQGTENPVQGGGSLDSIDERNEAEKQIFVLVKFKDYRGLKQLISSNRGGINANTQDLDGNSLLQVAVKTKDQRIVRAVLNIDPRTIDTNDGLLQAIEDNEMELVLQLLLFGDSREKGQFFSATQMLLLQKKDELKAARKKSGILDVDQNKYGKSITPMIQAAKCGHYEIMEVLYDRGERLPQLHLPSCACIECEKKTRELERTVRRIDLLKAMANPTYLIFMAGKDGDFDPVLEAFNLTEKLSRCIEEEPEYKQDYEEIKEEIEKLPVDLIKLCRTMEEVKVFLSPKEGYIGPSWNQYPRLAVAIDKEQKALVSEPNIQFIMYNEFMGLHWSPASKFMKMVRYFILLLMIGLAPLVSLFLFFATCCCTGTTFYQFLMSPVNRALMKLGSYIWFCVALLVMNSEERPEADIVPPTEYVWMIVAIFVVSHIFALIRRSTLHPVGFFKRGWNLYDLVTQLLFLTSFGIWGFLFYRKNHLGFEEILPRRTLKWYDPLLVEECVFALASAMATFRLSRWYLLHPVVGPFQTGYAHMADQVKTVLFFVLWVLGTFTVSTSILYRPYLDLKKWNSVKGVEDSQPRDMADPEKMFLTFFGVASMGPGQVEIFKANKSFHAPKGGLLKLENGKEILNPTTEMEVKFVTNEQVTTQWFMKIICVVFNVVVITFLKDATVGLFGSKGAEVLEKKDVEWRFTRVKEWLYYMEDSDLAPPFNMIPNGMCCCGVFEWICVAFFKGKDGKHQRKAGCNSTQCCYVQDVESEGERRNSKREYASLMRKLFQRYFQLQRWNESEENVPTKGDKRVVEEKVKELREVLENWNAGEEGEGDDVTRSQSAPAVKAPPESSIKVLAK